MTDENSHGALDDATRMLLQGQGVDLLRCTITDASLVPHSGFPVQHYLGICVLLCKQNLLSMQHVNDRSEACTDNYMLSLRDTMVMLLASSSGTVDGERLLLGLVLHGDVKAGCETVLTDGTETERAWWGQCCARTLSVFGYKSTAPMSRRVPRTTQRRRAIRHSGTT